MKPLPISLSICTMTSLGCWSMPDQGLVDGGGDNEMRTNGASDSYSEELEDVDAGRLSDLEAEWDTKRDHEGAPQGCEGALCFADRNLEGAVRDEIDKPDGDIYFKDVKGLTSLGAAYADISDLSGVQCLAYLTDLDLGYNDISDLTPLAALTGLAVLSLSGNSVNDLLPLAELTDLATLDLGANSIRDISSLSSLTKLTSLYLGKNYISDLEPLYGLGRLCLLDLVANPLDCGDETTMDYLIALENRGVRLAHDCRRDD